MKGAFFKIPREFFIDGSLVLKKNTFLRNFCFLLNIFILPIAIFWLFNQHVLLGCSLLLFLSTFNANVYAFFHERPFVVAYSLVMICLSLTLTLAVYYRGFSAVFWTYPIIIAIYFIIPLRNANLFNLITVIPITTLLMFEYPIEFTLRYGASIAATFMLGNILVSTILELHQQLINQSITDPLTGAYNRRKMDETLNKLIVNFQNTPQNIAIIMIDIDFFKKINDNYGHEAGDITLCNLVNKLQQVTRKTDKVFRIGGEEFLVVLTDTDPQQALAIAQSLRVSVNEILVPDTAIAITASFGLSMLSPEMDCKQWLSDADKSLYKAKQTGRDKVVSNISTPTIINNLRPIQQA